MARRPEPVNNNRELHFWLEGNILVELLDNGWYKAYCCNKQCGTTTTTPDREELDKWVVAHDASHE